MTYIPKSKIKIKTAFKNELVFVRNNEPFEGQYMETNTGKLYAGTNNFLIERELKPAPQPTPKDGYGNLSTSLDVAIHHILHPNKKNFLDGVTTIRGSKPQPTEKDYNRGYYTRYFVKKINNFDYKEINKEIYDSIYTKRNAYDYNLYEVGSINWHLTGNVNKKNNTSIKVTSAFFPNINLLFSNLSEYYRSDSIETVQNNLYTNGKELYYSDGKEYIGPYHIHPEKGPMVGAEHSSIPHDKLYYSNQLPNKNNLNIFDLTKPTTSKPGLDRPTISTNDGIVRSTSTPPSPPSIPSTGGSGY